MPGFRSPDRVWFIGAGFSAGLGYPLGFQLLPQLIQYLQGTFKLRGRSGYRFSNTSQYKGNKNLSARIVQEIDEFMRTYFALNLSQSEEVNVAEFFTIAHTLCGTSPLLRPTAELQTTSSDAALYEVLAAATRTFFLDISRLTEVKDQPADFLKLLEEFEPERDAIISFNWDEELDLGLSELSDIAFTLADWAKERCYLILKPHGSIGWYDVTQGVYNEDGYFIAANDDRLPRAKQRVMAYLEMEHPIDIDGRAHPAFACPPLIMPPTFAKRFDYPEQQNVWQDVLKVCRDAKEFIFLGYSLPPDDFLTRAAIRSAISTKEVTKLRCLVVGKSDNVLANAQTIFQKGLHRDRNFLQFTFGSDDPSLAKQIRSKLPGAKISQ